MTLKQIQASEEIMRIAVNGQNHVDSLIGYYRDCIDKFNQERAQWALYYQMCKQNISNRHILQRQLAQINNKKIDLQTQLSSTKGQLTFQRQKYFQKIQHNQRIKNNLEQNKKRLKQLTEICKPPLNIEHSRAKSSYSVKTNAFGEVSLGQKMPFKNQKIMGGGEKENLNQNNSTLVNNQLSQLELQLINLNKQHEQKKQKLQKTIDQLKTQLQDLVSQHLSRGQQCSQQYKIALNRLSDLEMKHQNLISEFFKYRMNGIEEEQRVQQQNQVIRLKNMALVQRLKQLQDSHSEEFKNVESQVKKKNKEFKLKYDQQLKKKEEHLSILKEQNERIADIYLNKLKKLQTELRQTTQKARTIQQKTKVQVLSLKSQIKILANRLQNVAMNNMRSDLAPNNQQQSEQQSSATLEIQELDRINKQVKDLQKQLDKNKKQR